MAMHHDRNRGRQADFDVSRVEPDALAGMADEDVMVCVRDGSATMAETAFGELYSRWSGPLFGFFVRMARNRAFSEDLVQETFLRLWRARERYQPTGKFSTYLFQIGRNHFLNEVDKLNRRVSPWSLDGTDSRDDDGGGRDVEGDVAGPGEQAETDELRRQVREAVDRLTDKEKEVFVLAVYQGFTYRETADILGIPLGTVKSRMSGAHTRLAGILEDAVDVDGTR